MAYCPQASLSHLLNPTPPQGRVTLTLAFKGLLQYRHQYAPGDGRAQGLSEAGAWHIESVPNQGGTNLDVQIARSEWYEDVVAKLGIGNYLVTHVSLSFGLPAGKATLDHLDAAAGRRGQRQSGRSVLRMPGCDRRPARRQDEHLRRHTGRQEAGCDRRIDEGSRPVPPLRPPRRPEHWRPARRRVPRRPKGCGIRLPHHKTADVAYCRSHA